MGRFDNLQVDEKVKQDNNKKYDVEDVIKKMDKINKKLEILESKENELIESIEIMQNAQNEVNEEFTKYVRIVEQNTKYSNDTFEKSEKLKNEIKRERDEVMKDFNEIEKKAKGMNSLLNKRIKPLKGLTMINIMIMIGLVGFVAYKGLNSGLLQL